MMIFPQASRLRDKLFPVDGRGNAVAGLENPGKMILVRKIEKRGNLGDRHGGIRQKVLKRWMIWRTEIPSAFEMSFRRKC